MELDPGFLDNRDRIPVSRLGAFEIPLLLFNLPQAVQRFPLFFGGPEFFRHRKGSIEFRSSRFKRALQQVGFAKVEMRLHFFTAVLNLGGQFENAAEDPLGVWQIVQIERVNNSDVLQYSNLTVSVTIFGEKRLGILVSLERLPRIAQPAIQSAEVRLDVSAVPGRKRFGRRFDAAINFERLLIPAQLLEKSGLVEIRDLPPIILPVLRRNLADHLFRSLIAAHGFQIVAFEVIRAADVVEYLNFIFRVMNASGQRQCGGEILASRLVVPQIDLGESLDIDSVRFAFCIADLVEGAG